MGSNPAWRMQQSQAPHSVGERWPTWCQPEPTGGAARGAKDLDLFPRLYVYAVPRIISAQIDHLRELNRQTAVVGCALSDAVTRAGLTPARLKEAQNALRKDLLAVESQMREVSKSLRQHRGGKRDAAARQLISDARVLRKRACRIILAIERLFDFHLPNRFLEPLIIGEPFRGRNPSSRNSSFNSCCYTFARMQRDTAALLFHVFPIWSHQHER